MSRFSKRKPGRDLVRKVMDDKRKALLLQKANVSRQIEVCAAAQKLLSTYQFKTDPPPNDPSMQFFTINRGGFGPSSW